MLNKRQEAIRKWEQLTLVKCKWIIIWNEMYDRSACLSAYVLQCCNNCATIWRFFVKNLFLVLREPTYWWPCTPVDSGGLPTLSCLSTHQTLAANLARQRKKFIVCISLVNSLKTLNCYFDGIRFCLSKLFCYLNQKGFIIWVKILLDVGHISLTVCCHYNML